MVQIFLIKLFERFMKMTAYVDDQLCQFLANNDYKDIKTYLREGKSNKKIIKVDGNVKKIDDGYDHFSFSDKFVQWMTITPIK